MPTFKDILDVSDCVNNSTRVLSSENQNHISRVEVSVFDSVGERRLAKHVHVVDRVALINHVLENVGSAPKCAEVKQREKLRKEGKVNAF